MTSRPSVVVVGGGVGGLCAAIRLRAAGHDVTLLERNERVGGKLATFHRDGFTFDVGPSLITLPHLLDDVFRVAGTTLADQLDLVRLDPQFRYFWGDGSALTVHDDDVATAAEFEAFRPGAGAAWRGFVGRGGDIWEVAQRTFFAGPMSGPLSLLQRMESPRDLLRIDGLRTLNDAARDTFADDRLRQWAGRYATYSGSSPRHVPATMACIPYIEAEYGCWYPMGGLGALRDAFERLAIDVGVEVRTSTEVVDVVADARAVSGVQLADGAFLDAGIVIANVDAEHLYADLVPDDRALRRVRRAGRSTSAFVLCVGARGTTPGIGHHNVWFSRDSYQEFRALDAGQVAEDPTIYGCVSAVTDASQAPDGDENWFLLVNVPAGAEIDTERYRDVVLARLADHGVDLRDRMEFAARMTPADIERLYRSPGGAIYGTSSNGIRAAFARPANRGTRDGLYLVGGSSHPGGGLPLVATSAQIVAEMIADDLR